MKRLTTILKSTFFGFLVLNIILSIIIFLDFAIEGKEIPWEYLGFVNLYGIIVSLVFGYMDRPKLEKLLLIGFIICASASLITSFIIENQAFRMHSFYLLFGIFIGRNMVLIVDKFLSKNNS